MYRLIEALKLVMPPTSFHVVGTNGKGTVSTMLAAAYQAAGKRTGLFTSPHIEDFTERIQVDSQVISKNEVCAFARRLANLDLSPKPAFFELSFALALEHFASKQVELAIIEAGVGAKNDATINLKNVRALVITAIGRDHVDTLGPSLREIARDKAEAIRPGVPVITAAKGEALEVIAAVASGRRSPLFMDIPYSQLFSLPQFEALKTHDPVRWQNQRLAAAALRIAGNVSEDAIKTGISHPPLAARAEVFYVYGRKVILDGAHNPSAAQALQSQIKTPYVLVFGTRPNKLGEETLAVLEPAALKTFITQVDKRVSTLQKQGRTWVPEPVKALEQALAASLPEASVVIAGSLYLAGELRPFLRANHQEVYATQL